MPIVNFVTEKKQIEVAVGANLRKEAIKAGIKLYGGINGFGASINEVVNCHGLGHCGTCRVKIVKGRENVKPAALTMSERVSFTLNPLAQAAYLGNEDTMRLACCTQVMGDLSVETKPDMNLTGENFFS